MKAHSICKIIPPMEKIEYEELVDDIKKYGVIEPIKTFEGKIIDGIHRYRACEQLGIKCPTEEWNGEEKDLGRYVLSMNAKRRHLNVSQMSVITLNYLDWEEQQAKERQKEGGRKGGKKSRKSSASKSNKTKSKTKTTKKKSSKSKGIDTDKVEQDINSDYENASSPQTKKSDRAPQSREIAAEHANVSHESIRKAKLIRSKAPEILYLIEKGDLSLQAAEQILKKIPSDDCLKVARIAARKGITPALEEYYAETEKTAGMHTLGDLLQGAYKLAKQLQNKLLRARGIVEAHHLTVTGNHWSMLCNQILLINSAIKAIEGEKYGNGRDTANRSGLLGPTTKAP